MKRLPKILLIVGGSLGGLVVLIVLAVLVVVQTDWFRNYARGKLAAAISQASGGRAEVGGFRLSLVGLRAEVDDFVLHGTEEAGRPPLARVRSLVVALKWGPLLHGKVNLDSLEIEQPQVAVEVKPDGTTNIPETKTKSTKKSDPIQTVMDLAVGHFALRDGLLAFNDRKTPFAVEGDQLRAQMFFEPAAPRYRGTLAMTPVYVQQGNQPRLPVNTSIAFAIAQNRIEINSAKFDTPESKVVVAATVANLANPDGTVKVKGLLSPPELARTFGLKTAEGFRKAPPVDLALTAGLKGNALNLVGLQLAAGGTRFEASGVLQDLQNMAGTLRFNGRLAFGELGRIFTVSSRPEGTVELAGDVRLRGTQNYEIGAKVDGQDLSFQSGATRIAGVSAHTDVNVKPDLIAAPVIQVAALGGTFQGSADVARMDRFRLDGTLSRFDLKYLASKYASKNVVWDGLLSGPVHVNGSLKGDVARSLVANARIGIRPGHNGVPISGDLNVSYNGPRDTINLGNSYVQLPATRLGFSGAIGNQLNVVLTSRNLNDLLPAITMTSPNPPQSLPVTLGKGGAAEFRGTVSGKLSSPVVAGHLALTNFAANGQQFNSFAADMNGQSTGATVQNLLLTGKGIEARANASVVLQNWKPVDSGAVSASLAVRSANVHDLLAAAGKGDTPFGGALAVDAQVNGTVGDPKGTADLNVSNGTASDEPFDRIQAHVDYSGQDVQITNAQIAVPAGQVNARASFHHPRNDFQRGTLQWEITSTPIQVQQLQTVRSRQPGLAGTANLNITGAANLLPPAGDRPRVELLRLDANIGARSMQLNQRRVGDLTLVANTAGQTLNFKIDSDVASSSIHGGGRMVLSGDYPVNATIAFHPIRLAPVMQLASNQAQGGPPGFDGTIDGTLVVSGPAMRPIEMKGTLSLGTVSVTTVAPAAAGRTRQRPVEVRNLAPMVVSLDRQAVRIEPVHFVGPSTNLSLSGIVNLAGKQAIDISANGNLGLEIAQTFSSDVYASGNIVLAADVKGQLSAPSISGKLQLVNASINYVDAPNGLSYANGTILFNGRQAIIQSLTGESGGGKVEMSGLVNYGGPQLDFRLRAAARRVRVRQSNISVQVNANVDLAGNSQRSILSGDVTILQVAMYSHTDIGSMLSQTAAPPTTPSVQSGMLAGMQLDVRVRTSPAVQFLTSLTQNLEATADLRVRGTAAQPGLTGHVVATQGDIVFFGSKYTIDQGQINFYDPTRIVPVLAVSLETQASGVDVTLAVNGPMDNLKLTYQSDPPLQFSDIVSLLATGKPPSSDPVLAASQPPAPQQSMEQVGASAVLSQAVANPVSGRLQRLFGVTKLKIDPQVLGGATNTVQARMTLQQQITRDLSFTYIQDVRESNPQVIRVEWAIDPTWSAVALRQENGEFGVDFFYKKRFR